MTKIMVLSPHLDDAALSCGDYIASLIKEGNKVNVLTIFTVYPPAENLSKLAQKFFSEWESPDEATQNRQEEDKEAMDVLGCEFKYLPLTECLYRKGTNGEYKYKEEYFEIYTQDYDKERDTIEELKKYFRDEIKDKNIDIIISPLGIGRHIDHLITRRAIEEIKGECNINLFYYEDMPYAEAGRDLNWVQELTQELENIFIEIDDDSWNKKIDAIDCYRSQLNMLWISKEERERQYYKNSHRRIRLYRGSN